MSAATKRSATRSGAGPSDAALVVAARADEAWAKEALFQRHAPMVNGLAYRLLGRDNELDDLVQDSFFQAFSCLGKLSEPQAFASWMASIVVRTVRKHLRRRRLARTILRVPQEPIDPDSLISPSASPEDAEVLRRTYVGLAALPSDERIALVLQRIEDWPLGDIATSMGTSVATVKRRIAAATRTLQTGIKP